MTSTPITESDLQKAVIELANTLGYIVAHFRPALTGRGWRTPVEGDGRGFPDLVIVGHKRVIFAELKSESGKLSEMQQLWLSRLLVTGAETFLWRPHDWTSGAIEEALRTPSFLKDAA